METRTLKRPGRNWKALGGQNLIALIRYSVAVRYRRAWILYLPEDRM